MIFLLLFLFFVFYLQYLLFQPPMTTYFMSYAFFFKFNSMLDFYTEFFIVFVVYIGSMIMIYSTYYMTNYEILIFWGYLYYFIVFMICLVCGDNLFSMFLGWEGVGVMSFLLIGWYSSREKASFSSKKAILYNRISDFFFVFMICLEIFENNSFFWGEVFMKKEDMEVSFFFQNFKYVILSSFLMSIMGKSAQFSFHPWLTSAMEGPTPVSALLHSSTMVVAGVFLFFKMHYFLMSNVNFVFFLFFFSCLTNFLSSMSAFFFKDQKKVIALSTTSQLSFMIMILCLGEKELGFFHMILHGFFKALLFLTSGIFIHKTQNLQNSFSQGIGTLNMYWYSTIFFLSNWGLTGLPFIGAFWSKHSLINLLENYTMGYFCFFLVFLSFIFTMGYSIRLSLSSMKFKGKANNESETNEKMNFFMIIPLWGLLLGVFFCGMTMKSLIYSCEGDFFSSSQMNTSIVFFVFFLGLILHYSFPETSFFWHYFMYSSNINRFFFYFFSKSNLSLLESSLEKNIFLELLQKTNLSFFLKKSIFLCFPFHVNFVFVFGGSMILLFFSFVF